MGTLGYAVLYAELQVQAMDAWGSVYYESYHMDIPPVFSRVLGVRCDIRTGSGIWSCQPFGVGTGGFDYYVTSPRSESVSMKDMVFEVTGVLA